MSQTFEEYKCHIYNQSSNYELVDIHRSICSIDISKLTPLIIVTFIIASNLRSTALFCSILLCYCQAHDYQ